MNKIISILILLFVIIIPIKAQAQPFPIFILESYLGTLPSPPYTYPFTQYANGVLVLFNWSDIQPTDTTPVWTNIDAVKAAADAAGAYWSIGIVAGQRTPTWLYSEDPASQFASCNGTVSVPIPWDTTFQTKWNTLVADFAARYCPAGVCDPLLHHVDLMGINYQFPSIGLPTNTTGGTCATLNDTDLWGEANSACSSNGVPYTCCTGSTTGTCPGTTSAAQRLTLINYIGTAYGSRTIYENDGQNCTTTVPADCFVDSVINTAATTYNASVIYQSTAPQLTYGTCSNNTAIACTTTNVVTDCGAGPTCTAGNYWLINTAIQAVHNASSAVISYEAYPSDVPHISFQGGSSNW